MEHARVTHCGRGLSEEGHTLAIAANEVDVNSICRRCAEMWVNVLEAMGLIENGVYRH
jgi:hypothetical protein